MYGSNNVFIGYLIFEMFFILVSNLGKDFK